jgi:hypothetical protein
MFSFTQICTRYYVLTGGGHPFGRETHKREANIMEHAVDLSELQGPEAVEAQALIASMIREQPEGRISALQVLPMFYTNIAVASTDDLECRFIATRFSGDRASAFSSYAPSPTF